MNARLRRANRAALRMCRIIGITAAANILALVLVPLQANESIDRRGGAAWT